MNWSTSSGLSSLRLLSKWTWMFRGHEMRCWLLTYICHIVRIHSGCSLLFCFQSIFLNGIYRRILSKVLTWVKTHGYCCIEFEERGEHTWAFIRCWDDSQFRRVCVSILDRFSRNANGEVIVLERIIDALGPNVRVISVHGGPHAFVEAYVIFLGVAYQQKLNESSLSDLHLFKNCLQWTASSVFGNLDSNSMTEFIVNRLKGAESRDLMASRPALKKAIVASILGMSELVDVVDKIVWVSSLFVSYLKETVHTGDGNSLVVWSLYFEFYCHCFVPMYVSFSMFRRRRWIGTFI